MECLELKGPERRVMVGRVNKLNLYKMRKDRKDRERLDRLKRISKHRYTNVPKDLLDLYEDIYGVAEKFKSPPKSSVVSTTGSTRSSISLERASKDVHNLKHSTYLKTNYSTPILWKKASPSPSYISSPTPSYVPVLSNLNYFSPSKLSSASKRDSIGLIKEPLPSLAKTIIQRPCYTYYNTETFEQINSFEPLDPHKYNGSNSWINTKSIVNLSRLVPSRRVLKSEERLCWTYYNRRTGDQRSSFQRLEKTNDEDEWCEHIIVPQFVENPEEFSNEAELKRIQENISKESEKIIEENREYATEEEIQEELQCLEKVEEMGVQAAIKHIKEENKNDHNLKAYICRELSLKSPRHSEYNGIVKNKKRSAMRRLRDWIQCDGYPSLTLEQAEKLVVMLNSGDKVLVEGDKVSVRGNDLITLKKRGWLNDEVINFYVELILKRAANEPVKYPKIHMFNTFFYPLLEKKGYSGVARITKRAKVDIFSLDMVIVPIHLQIHWALAVINIKERRLEYYDSMSKGCNESVLSLLKHYVEEEYKDKKKASSYDMSEWKYHRVHNLPQQTNAYDCGVFSMTFAEHISRGASVLFSPPKYMKYFRLKMMWEIINSKLLPVDQQHQPDKVSEPGVKTNGSIINNHINSLGQKRTFEDQLYIR
ncbi:hypothetical protein C1645_722235 [Glomus cerebriforme]|uniref:Ubiquitin-like protease family profile domain-containing protein n=1 Tax=Glomus cerebriforme TaxID=658196 RepID=A0A397TH26_9GLOM|nr:hypothetical protein C1645_722235 [Glomus cerebriforme]